MAIADINEETAEITAEMVRAVGRKAEIYLSDVSDYDKTETMMEEIHNKFASVDILVNNAGIGSGSSFPEVTPEEWERDAEKNWRRSCAEFLWAGFKTVMIWLVPSYFWHLKQPGL